MGRMPAGSKSKNINAIKRFALCALAFSLTAEMAPALAMSEAVQANPHQASLTGMWLLRQGDYKPSKDIPYSAQGAKLAKEYWHSIENDHQVLRSDQKKCLPMGMPLFMVQEFPLAITESPGKITMISESSSLVRTVYLNRKAPSGEIGSMWNGYSVGAWKDNVLNVDTTNFNDRLQPIQWGLGLHAPSTRINEKIYTEEQGKTLVVETTFYDDVLLAQPWVITRRYDRMSDDAELMEYVCESDTEGWSERFRGESTSQ